MQDGPNDGTANASMLGLVSQLTVDFMLSCADIARLCLYSSKARLSTTCREPCICLHKTGSEQVAMLKLEVSVLQSEIAGMLAQVDICSQRRRMAMK